MHLERLEISGFKSFSDRSELAFDRGVTAIVGPNGCGKSNVADALTWVLGEQSAKSLRGDKMEDVIFSGSDARKPTGAAEVRLRFGNVIVPPSILRELGWSTDAFAPGSLSNGRKDQAAGAIFPLLPTSFIAVRNLTVSARWGRKDQSLITSKLGGSLSLGYGPFALSGNFGHGSTDKTFNSEFDGTTISNSGLQIIGWINQVVPESPPIVAQNG